MLTLKNRLAVAIVACLVITLSTSTLVRAQYPVAVKSYPGAYKPAVVGYTVEPAGLFGLQTRYRAVVAPVAVKPIQYVQPVYRSSFDPYSTSPARSMPTPVIRSTLPTPVNAARVVYPTRY